MEKTLYMRLKGSRCFRQRLILLTLAHKAIIIEDIRSDEMPPGLRSHEVSLLRLIERISDDCKVEINETGTKLKYKPGVLMGGKNLVHDCGIGRSIGWFLESLVVLGLRGKKSLSIRLKGTKLKYKPGVLMGGKNLVHDCGIGRSIGWFLEPLVVLGLRGKKSLSIRLKGITNDPKDPSVDTFRHTTFHILERFGVPKEGLQLKIESRGAPPLGGGEVILGVPTLSSLSAVTWIDPGKVKRIRGVTFTMKVSADFDHRMMYAARGVFNNFLPDVRIEKDHRSLLSAGRSKGYGMSVVAETDSECFMSADSAMCNPKADEMDVFDDSDEKPILLPPEDVGVQVASILLGEIEQGGVVDSTHQGLLFLLCALCPEDFSKVRVGKLTPYGIETLRHIREFLGVMFVLEPDSATNTVIAKCRGSGLPNLSRRIS